MYLDSGGSWLPSCTGLWEKEAGYRSGGEADRVQEKNKTMRHMFSISELTLFKDFQGFFGHGQWKTTCKKMNTEKNYERVKTKSFKLWVPAKSDRRAIGRDLEGTQTVREVVVARASCFFWEINHREAFGTLQRNVVFTGRRQSELGC